MLLCSGNSLRPDTEVQYGPESVELIYIISIVTSCKGVLIMGAVTGHAQSSY